MADVVLDAAGLDGGMMQAVAAELGAPTTGFVVASEAGTPPAVSVWYFTPLLEIDACGHATLAVFSALTEAGRLAAYGGEVRRVSVLGRATRTLTGVLELPGRLWRPR